MSQTFKLQAWKSTGTGIQVPEEVQVEVANGVIVGDSSGLAGSALEVRSEAAALAVNDLVYVSGWNETHALPLVTKADADASGRQAQFVVRTAIAQNANGVVYTAFRTAANLNTDSYGAVGDPVYLHTTAGGITETAPTGATAVVQIVGRIAVKSATVGVVEFDLRDFPTAGTNDIQDLAVTTGKLAADAVTNAKIADDQIDSEHYVADSIDAEHYAPLSVDTAALAADAVTGAKITNLAIGVKKVAAVVVDHADVSPKEILAADANVDRIVHVWAVATEAAAGDPDIDIGSAGSANDIIDDFGAGAWAVGDRFEGIINLPAGENLRATITAAGTAGAMNVFPTVLTAGVKTNQLGASAVTGAKITNAAFGLQGVAAVEVDHAAVSPFEILAADANNDRIALVYAVATEAATGDPDIDLGVTGTINSIAEDFKAGAWVVGDRVFNLVNVPKTAAVIATIAAAGTAGKLDVYVHILTPTIVRANLEADIIDGTKLADNAVDSEHITAGAVDNAHLAGSITRANLLEDALAVYGIPAHALKSDAGAALLAAETGGTFNISVSGNVVKVQGEITDNETEVSVGYFQFVLPPEYVAAGDVQLRIKTALIKTGAAVNNGSTIDAEAYEQDGNGVVGADICATAAQSWAADDTWYTKTFTITATTLVAGDILNVKITTSVIDSEAGAGTLRANLDGIAVLLDIKG